MMTVSLWLATIGYAAVTATLCLLVLHLDPRLGVWWVLAAMLALGILGMI